MIAKIQVWNYAESSICSKRFDNRVEDVTRIKFKYYFAATIFTMTAADADVTTAADADTAVALLLYSIQFNIQQM